MAFEAGARVADLEFVQFHPTVLSVDGRAAVPAVGGAARRGRAAGQRRPASASCQRYEPAGDLASRDLVARAIVREVERTGAPVYLTMAHLDPDYVRSRFPTITAGVPRRPGSIWRPIGFR